MYYNNQWRRKIQKTERRIRMIKSKKSDAEKDKATEEGQWIKINRIIRQNNRSA